MQELIIADKKYLVIELPGRPKALLDRTVAEVYEVETKEINQATRNNPDKFPADFCFELTKEEFEVVKNFDLLGNLKYSNVLPKAFTWEGCNMLATILKSEVATQRAIQIVRAFTKLEKVAATAPSSLLSQAKMLVLAIEQQEQLAAEQKRQAEQLQQQSLQLRQIAARQDAIIDQSGFYSIMAYAKLHGFRITATMAAQFGKTATKISKERGITVGKVRDPRYGEVGTYHETVLDDVFGEPI